MFPMLFDRKILDTLPFQDRESMDRVLQILKTITIRRVFPYFRNKRGTDPALILQVRDHLTIRRLEDEENQVALVCLISMEERQWVIHIHERVFDYLAFVIPSDPESRLGGETPEEGKILAFFEYMLRHEVEHALYPERPEREVLRSDVSFALDRRTQDPTYYRMLREALADEMNGLKGKSFLDLLDAAEEGRPSEYLITRILAPYLSVLADIPQHLMEGVFPHLDKDLKKKVLGDYYRRSRDESEPLAHRTLFLEKILRLFTLLIESNKGEAEEIFRTFRDHWGVVYLFHELDFPEAAIEDKGPEELFALFRDHLMKLSADKGQEVPTISHASSTATPATQPPEKPVKSLKDRIEEARNDPAFPRQVIEVIEKNKVNAVGHSGPKYSELIETLLAIPWDRDEIIEVSPEAFEQGLDRSHYGLRRPKEIICDFFTNLIWRYQNLKEQDAKSWHAYGSSFLFVGPPGVGKTSLAISIARNLGLGYHKVSLGGMRDEADLRGHGFTYEGSKPGAIVQGLIKMGIMNGMFIMDEADKTEKFAIATLLEILDPEQNHLFHDRYIETTVDIDLSNSLFILTANTLETVPPPVANRCEIVMLDRYSVEEKIAIAQEHLIKRVRERHQISAEDVFFDPDQEKAILRHLIKTYTQEAGVRQLERIIRTLFLRVLRKEVLAKGERGIRITREKLKQYLEIPTLSRQINEEDRIGEMLALGVNLEHGIGSIIPIQATKIRRGDGAETDMRGQLSMAHATGNIQRIMDESRKVASTGILHCAEELAIDLSQVDTPVHLHFMGASTQKDGPSAGGAIALALASTLTGRKIRRDVAMTGEVDTHGRITAVGGLDVKLETAYAAGCKTLIIPKENLYGEEGIERLPDTLKGEIQILTYDAWAQAHEPFDFGRQVIQIVAVNHIVQAADIAFINEEELHALERVFVPHGRLIGAALKRLRKRGGKCRHLICAKELKELDLERFEATFKDPFKYSFLLKPDVKKEMLERLPGLKETATFFDFDPSRRHLVSVIREMSAPGANRPSRPLRVSVSAPFFFLKRDGIRTTDFPPSKDMEGITLFANNYTVQDIKIKTCKPVLNRVIAHLSQLDRTQLDACPFLGKKDDVYVVDLSFIPEKYRLDLDRAERILTGALDQWLSALEGSDDGDGKEGGARETDK